MKRFLIRDYVPLLVVIFLSIVASIFIYQKANTPNDYEKICVFVSATTVDADYLSEKINMDDLKAITYLYTDPTDEYYFERLQTVITDADLLIVPKSILEKDGSENTFILLSDEICDKYGIDLSKYEVFTKEDKKLGVRVDNIFTISFYPDGFEGEKEEFYLVINDTINSKLNPQDKESDNSFKAFSNLIK